MKCEKIHHNLFLAILLLVVSTGPVFALEPEPSPAGGGALEIAKRGGHVFVEDHDDFDANLFNEAKFEATLEMWIYLKRALKFGESWVLFHKERSYIMTFNGHWIDIFDRLVLLDPQVVALCFYHRWERGDGGGAGGGGAFTLKLLLNQWYHLVFMFSKKGDTFYLNGTRLTSGNFLPRRISNLNFPLYIGGTGIFDTVFLEDVKEGKGIPFTGGLIDEVRVSDIARYPFDNLRIAVPTDRFNPDDNTLALWHFDGGRANWLKDASGNGHTLTAVKSVYLHVESRGKLPTLWGQIKRHFQ